MINPWNAGTPMLGGAQDLSSSKKGSSRGGGKIGKWLKTHAVALNKLDALSIVGKVVGLSSIAVATGGLAGRVVANKFIEKSRQETFNKKDYERL